ncbi:MAG: alpha/beta hydrolase, partial [Spirochaetota bacterium]
MNDPRRRSSIPSIFLILALATTAVAFALYFRPSASSTASTVLESSGTVRVVSGKKALAFLPLRSQGCGLVFYPGARVPAEAYAYLGRALAERGHTTLIARFPLGMAVFAKDRAGMLITDHPEVDAWMIAGHSLGGAMAASWLRDHRGAARGLILLASFPPGSVNLAESGLRVLQLSASMDGLVAPAASAASRALLPKNTRFVVLEGGNHANFGEYGRQDG